MALVYPGPAPSGGVLVVGGTDAVGEWLRAAELYDVARDRWSRLPDVPDAATCRARLAVAGDGSALLVGGGGGRGCADDGATVNAVRRYDVLERRWHAARCQSPCVQTAAGTLAQRDGRWAPASCEPRGPCPSWARNDGSLIALADGSLFSVGGCAGACAGPNALGQSASMVLPDGGVVSELSRAAERYDIASRTWRPEAPSAARHMHRLAVQQGTNVLVCGPSSISSGELARGVVESGSTCETFDPNHSAWSDAGAMPEGLQAMVSLGSMGVLGVTPTESWRWRGGAWFDRTPLVATQRWGRLAALPSGGALLSGGAEALATTQIYTFDPAKDSGTWSTGPELAQGREAHVVLSLPDGRVLVTGGWASRPLASTEIFDPGSGRWVAAADLPTPRAEPEAVVLPP